MSVLEVFKSAIKHLILYICCFVIAFCLYSFCVGIISVIFGEQLKYEEFSEEFSTLLVASLIFVAPTGLIPHAIILLSIKKYTLSNWYNYAIGAGILPLFTMGSFLLGVFGIIVCVAIFFALTFFKKRANHYYIIALLTMPSLVALVLSVINGSISEDLTFAVLLPIGVVTGVIYWWLEQKLTNIAVPASINILKR